MATSEQNPYEPPSDEPAIRKQTTRMWKLACLSAFTTTGVCSVIVLDDFIWRIIDRSDAGLIGVVGGLSFCLGIVFGIGWIIQAAFARRGKMSRI